MKKILTYEYNKKSSLVNTSVEDEKTKATWKETLTQEDFEYRIWKQEMFNRGSLTEKDIDKLDELVFNIASAEDFYGGF